MLNEYIENMDKLSANADAILIISKDGYVEYSATHSKGTECLSRDEFIGKHIMEVYPTLTEETSTHYRVMRTGEPIINERQSLRDIFGDFYTYNNSSFPIRTGDDIIGTIEISTIISKNQNDKDIKKDGGQSNKNLYELQDIIGQSPSMINIKEQIRKLATSDSCALIWGETGTGKELIAESLHTSSRRKTKPFISLNCSALPATIVEGLLFGTEKGSFTGAEDKKGLFELANGGTMFLDELNSMDLALQPKILKVIEQQKVRRLGGEKEIDLDIRFIAAMNKDPEEAIEEGALRMDLYYRLSIIQIHIPPLRERREDIVVMAQSFIDYYNNQFDKDVKGMTDIVKSFFNKHPWKGNVRELKNAIEYAVSITNDPMITMQDLPNRIIYSKDDEAVSPLSRLLSMSDVKEHSLKERMEEYEKSLIEQALQSSKNVTIAAKKLKITRQALQYKMQKYDIFFK